MSIKPMENKKKPKQTNKTKKKQLKNKKNPDKSPGLIIVESEGFEPSSKRRFFKLSTCLVSDWFSIKARTETPKTLT